MPAVVGRVMIEGFGQRRREDGDDVPQRCRIADGRRAEFARRPDRGNAALPAQIMDGDAERTLAPRNDAYDTLRTGQWRAKGEDRDVAVACIATA